MKIANFADLHARGKDLPAFRSQWNKALEKAVNKGAEIITIAGDVFDSPQIGDRYASTGAIIGAVLNPLYEAAQQVSAIIIIPGNHDARSGDDSDALSAIEYIPNVTVAREFEWLQFEGVDVFTAPFKWNDWELDQAVANEESQTDEFGIYPRLFLGHFPIAGANMGATTAEKGLSRSALNSLHFERYALGDFHKRQDLFDGRGGYVGALRQMNFGEGNNPQGFEIWDTETNKTEWVEVCEAPRYVTVTLSEPVIDTDYLCAVADNDHVRLICDGFKPTIEQKSILESARVIIEYSMERQERVTRLSELPEGIIQDDPELIKMWAGVQEPPVSDDTVNNLITLHQGAV